MERLQVRSSPHRVAFFLAAMVSLVIVGGVSAPAMAHAGHSHQPAKITTTSKPPYLVPVANVKTSSKTRALRHRFARYTLSSHRIPRVSEGESSCCCGSFVWHACVTLSVQEPQLPVPTGERLTHGPSGGIVQHCPLRLDRPPRTTHSCNAGRRPAA